MVDTRHIILLRKLGILRAVRLRLGAGWVHKMSGIVPGFRASEFCRDDVWSPEFTKLEAWLRDYGYVDPLDELGALPKYIGILLEACARDLANAKRIQNPRLKETAGSLENMSGDPNNGLSLAAELSALLGQTAAPIPEPRPAVSRPKDAREEAILESAVSSFRDHKSLRKAERAYTLAKNTAKKKRQAERKKLATARKLKPVPTNP